MMDEKTRVACAKNMNYECGSEIKVASTKTPKERLPVSFLQPQAGGSKATLPRLQG